MTKKKSDETSGGFAFDGEPYLEVTEWGPDANGKFALDDDGDPKNGFYWSVMRGPGVPYGSEVGPYGEHADALKAGRQAWADGSF